MKKRFKFMFIEYIPFVLVTLILIRIILDIDSIVIAGATFISNLLSYSTIFIIAFAFAFLLNPFMMALEKRWRFSRTKSVLTVYIVSVSFLLLLVFFMIPTLLGSISDFISEVPTYVDNIEILFNDISNNMDKETATYLQGIFESSILPTLETLEKTVFNLEFILGNIVIALLSVVNTFMGIFTFILGIFISVNFLSDKEFFLNGFTKITKALFKPRTANSLISFTKHSASLYQSFVVGKFIDSLIIATLFFIGTLFINIPFAPLATAIIGVTNMIPYFGPFIGGIPVAIITLLTTGSLSTFLAVGLFILFLQQLDGWVIGPKILGFSIGLHPFWIVFATLLGGSYFGPVGMFLGSPTLAVAKYGMDMILDKRLKAREAESLATPDGVLTETTNGKNSDDTSK